MSDEMADRGGREAEEQERLLDEAERAVEEAEQRMARSERELRPLGVLVIEDDPDLQWRLARMLTSRGNRVVGTSSAEAALELLARWPVDLVLVDDELPGMSGRALAAEVHRSHPGIPVVLMSSKHDSGVIPSTRGAGIVACFAKPLGVEALLAILAILPTLTPDLVPAE